MIYLIFLYPIKRVNSRFDWGRWPFLGCCLPSLQVLNEENRFALSRDSCRCGSCQQRANELRSRWGHFLAISDLAFRVRGPLFFIMVTFSRVHNPQMPPGATGVRLPIILQDIGGVGFKFWFQTWVASVVSLLLFSFLNDAVWFLYRVLNAFAVLP